MKMRPCFKTKEPSNPEEKLIMELVKSLNEVTHIFIKLNNPGNITNETFVILRDAAIGYAGSMIRDLGVLLEDRNQKQDFLLEAKDIFNCYIGDISRELK